MNRGADLTAVRQWRSLDTATVASAQLLPDGDQQRGEDLQAAEHGGEGAHARRAAQAHA